MATWVKICGCTSPEDVALAADAGADAFGMIFAPSPRQITWEAAAAIAHALPSLPIEPVAVFVDPTMAQIAAVEMIFPHIRVQFSGMESAELVHAYGDRAIKAIHVGTHDDPDDIELACKLFPLASILFDTKVEGAGGGTGRTFPWSSIGGRIAGRDVIVAGGLSADNVASCVSTLHPGGVDVRSGVETNNHKDPEKVRAFVRAVRAADET